MLTLRLSPINTPSTFGRSASAINGTVIGVVSASRVCRSTDNGENFVNIDLPITAPFSWTGIATNGSGRWVLIPYASDQYVYSNNDGLSWSVGTLPGGALARFDCCWHGSKFYSFSGADLISSPNGQAPWTNHGAVGSGPSWMVSTGTNLVMGGGGNVDLAYTADGSSITTAAVGFPVGSYSGMSMPGTGVVIALPSDDSQIAKRSTDHGLTYSDMDMPFHGPSNSGIQSGGVVDGKFVIVWSYLSAHAGVDDDEFIEFTESAYQFGYNAMNSPFMSYYNGTNRNARMQIVPAGEPFWKDHINCESV